METNTSAELFVGPIHYITKDWWKMPNCQVYFKVKPGIVVMMENVQNNKWNNFFKANKIDRFLNFKSKN